ncbi:metallophosphoesterase [Luteimonas sp. e5]
MSVLLSVMLLIGLYVAWRGLRPWRLPRLAWLAAALLVWLLLLQYPLISMISGSFASPEVPRWIQVVLAIGMHALMILAVLLLLRDVVGIVIALPARARARAWWASRKLVAGLAVGALALSVFGVWQAIKVPSLRRVEIGIAGLPAAFDGYRIAHLTDIHASRLLPRKRVEQVVARSNAIGADVILISGDIVDGSVAARADDYPPLAGLAAPDGVIAVPGNHEYYSGHAEWMPTFQRIGITMLQNDHVRIVRDGQSLVIAGLTDDTARDFGLPAPDLAQALAGVEPDSRVILLEHRPASARENLARGVDLQLSGHTHGGHVIGLHWLVARFNAGFVSGLYRVGGGTLYVSNGAGLWPGYAIRIGRPAEITEIILRSTTAPAHPSS